MTKFIALTKYTELPDVPPMPQWPAADIQINLDFLQAVNRELVQNGELVEGLALTGPELATIVTSDGTGAPVLTDRPFPEAKELLAGYQMVDVDSREPALEIAARVSSAHGPGSVPMRQPIEDAVQKALISAATHWPVDGQPDNPRGWSIQAASRKLTDQVRGEVARWRREESTALLEPSQVSIPAGDDSLTLLFMCEVTGLLALMPLTDARRPART